jgi:acetyl/propionyl-CoA carboxylase alpha subunit
VRFPNGPETRTDTYVYSGCNVPAAYDPLIAKIIVWGSDRAEALARMERALNELSFHGIATNVAWMRKAVSHPAVRRGDYSTETEIGTSNGSEVAVRDLAIASALVYARANEMTRARTPERMQGEWHRAARTLPE